MAVYFVYRTHDGAPSEKHVRRFEYDTVLDWARAIWKQFQKVEDARNYAENVLGVRELSDMFHFTEYRAGHRGPRDMAEVVGCFNEWYVEEESRGPHHFQLHIDFDEYETVLYVFDDHFRAEAPGKTDFLLVDGWELPAGAADGPLPPMPATNRCAHDGDGEGTLYVVGLFEDLMPAYRVEGLRVPDLARYLLTNSENDAEPFGLRELRGCLEGVLYAPTGEDAGFLIAIRDQPDELTHWGVYSDWLQDHGLPPAGLCLLDRTLRAKEYCLWDVGRKPELDLVKVTAHMAQACKHDARLVPRSLVQVGWENAFAQFIYFDDRWAAAHPTLAAGILTFASRWDVLT
jgi:uncharacterized protein (TIGR02996 family)